MSATLLDLRRCLPYAYEATDALLYYVIAMLFFGYYDAAATRYAYRRRLYAAERAACRYCFII